MIQRFITRRCLGGIAFVVIALTAGCETFALKQEIKVDAITSTKTMARGASYVLTVRNPSVAKESHTTTRAVAAVNAALESKGQFLAPEGTDPQYVVEIDFGIGNSIQQANSGPVQEKFLSLSARDYVRGKRGEELWNIRVTIVEAGTSVDYSLPMLAVAALDNAGTDTRGEITIQMPVKSPSVARIRSLTESAAIEAAAAGK